MTRMYQIRVTRSDSSPVFEDSDAIVETVTVFKRADLRDQVRIVRSWGDSDLRIRTLKLGRI